MTTYSTVASQFDAIQYTGSNQSAIQSWLTSHPQGGGGTPQLYARVGGADLLVINDLAQLPLNETDWVVTSRAVSGFPMEIPDTPEIAPGSGLASVITTLTNDQFTAWFTS